MKIRQAIKSDIEKWAKMRSLLWPDFQQDHIREISEYFNGSSIDIVHAFVIECGNGSLTDRVICFLKKLK